MTHRGRAGSTLAGICMGVVLCQGLCDGAYAQIAPEKDVLAERLSELDSAWARHEDVLKPRGEERLQHPIRTSGPPTASWYQNGFVALGLVLVVIAAAAWGLRKVAPRTGLANRGAIQVIHRTFLSSKQSLAVIKLGSRVMMIGITPENITHLATLEEGRDASILLENGKSTSPFGSLLGKEAATFREMDKFDADGVIADTNQLNQAGQSVRGLLDRIRSKKHPRQPSPGRVSR